MAVTDASVRASEKLQTLGADVHTNNEQSDLAVQVTTPQVKRVY